MYVFAMADHDMKSESDWFPETIATETPEEVLLKHLRAFFAKYCCRWGRGVDHDTSECSRVYWYRGALDDFMRRFGELSHSPKLRAELTLCGYQKPQYRGEAVACWKLSGPALPSAGSIFQVYDFERCIFIGSGSVSFDKFEGRVQCYADLKEGAWSDFYKVETKPRKLVLLICDAEGECS